MHSTVRWILPVAMICMAGCAGPVEHKVSSADDIKRIIPLLKPGDVVVMADGEWKDQDIWFYTKGAQDKPVTLRAQTPGKVIFTGKSSIALEGSHLVLQGVFLDHSSGDDDGIVVSGDNCRVTDCAIVGGRYDKFFLHLFGSEQRVDHCYFAEKTTGNPTFQIEVDPKRRNNDRVDHNHFGHRPPLGRNGGETMRIGYSWQSFNSSGALVEQNLYDRCDGEIEIISSKSCDNVYRGNTFLNCSGMFTLRHGNRCVVDGNFFIGNHKRGSGGIRVIGEDHVIVNNYMEAINNGAFWITAGIPESPLRGYFRAQRCMIAFNTIVDSKGPYIQLDAGMGTSNRSLMPDNIMIANNLFLLPRGEQLLKGEETQSYHWMGNIASGEGEIPRHAGIKAAEVKLERGEGGLLRPSMSSSVHGAAEGDFAKIKSDIDGQPRTGKYDVGCDQILKAPILSRPLSAADVGPTWMSVQERTSTENVESGKE